MPACHEHVGSAVYPISSRLMDANPTRRRHKRLPLTASTCAASCPVWSGASKARGIPYIAGIEKGRNHMAATLLPGGSDGIRTRDLRLDRPSC